MYKRPWHLARPLAVAALATIRECLWGTRRQKDTTFAMCKRKPRHRKASLPIAPSLLELQRERREMTELRYPGWCRQQPLETHGPFSGPPVAKSLVYGPGPGFSWRNRASSSPRFNTYSRGSTHLGAARPTLGFFLPFGSLTISTPVSNLKPGRWDLGPGLVGT